MAAVALKNGVAYIRRHDPPTQFDTAADAIDRSLVFDVQVKRIYQKGPVVLAGTEDAHKAHFQVVEKVAEIDIDIASGSGVTANRGAPQVYLRSKLPAVFLCGSPCGWTDSQTKDNNQRRNDQPELHS